MALFSGGLFCVSESGGGLFRGPFQQQSVELEA